MGDAHTDQERESTREYHYIMYLRQLKRYFTNSTRRNHYELMQLAEKVDFDYVGAGYWLDGHDFFKDKPLKDTIDKKIELLLKKDKVESGNFLQSIKWYQTIDEQQEFKKLLTKK